MKYQLVLISTETEHGPRQHFGSDAIVLTPGNHTILQLSASQIHRHIAKLTGSTAPLSFTRGNLEAGMNTIIHDKGCNQYFFAALNVLPGEPSAATDHRVLN